MLKSSTADMTFMFSPNRVLVSRLFSGWRCAVAALAVVSAGCDSQKAAAGAGERLGIAIKATGEELYGIEVEATSEGHKLSGGALGADGRMILRDAPVGDVEITVRDLRGRFATQTVSVESPGEHAIALVPGTTFRTTVRGEGGAVLDSVDLVAWGGGGDPQTFRLSGSQAAFGPLASGAFKLVVSASGYQTRVVDLNVKRTRAPVVRDLPDLRMKKGGATLRGRLVLDESHAGTLRAFLRHGGAGEGIEVLPDGSFALGGLAVESGALEATLVVRDHEGDLLARDLRIAGDLDLGRISLR